MNLTLAQIRAFDAIVRLGSFQAAAQELGLTQPSVSQRVHELEATLDTALFIRNGPRVSLTAEGHALTDHARRLIDDSTVIIERFRNHDPLRGLLRLGLNESFALVGLPKMLQKLIAQHPELKTSIHVGDTAEVSRLLNERKLDVGIVSQPDLEPHVHSELTGINQFAWFASPTLRLPRRVMSPADLAKFHLAMSSQTAQLHSTATAWFSRSGVKPVRVSLCNNLAVTIQLVLAGIAVGLIPLRVMQDHLCRCEVRTVRVAPDMPGHRVSLCYQASEFGSNLQQILTLIRTVVAEQKLFTSTAVRLR